MEHHFTFMKSKPLSLCPYMLAIVTSKNNFSQLAVVSSMPAGIHDMDIENKTKTYLLNYILK